MNKVLLISTVGGFINQFELSNVNLLKKLGYQIHYASNFNNLFYGDKDNLNYTDIICHQVDFCRSPYKLKENWQAYLQVKKICYEEHFNLIHCHTPMGGVIGRLVCCRDKNCKCIYTAHGFHFYKGAPFINWIIYYPIERLLSRYTDILITINKEDYKAARKFQAQQVRYIPGVGIDIDKYNIEISLEKCNEKRGELGVKKRDILLLSVGEINKNKNHQVVIQALSKLRKLPVKYLICGRGKRESKLKKLVKKLKLEDKVLFLGYRTDINEIYKMSNIFIFPSKREGLSVSLMEAMASGLPVICSNIRGNTDLIEDNKNGILCSNDIDYVNAIYKLSTQKEICDKYAEYTLKKIRNFSKTIVNDEMKKIYEQVGAQS